MVTHLDDIKSHTQVKVAWVGNTQLQLCVPANHNACRRASYLCESSICLFACLRAPAVSLLQRNACWRLKAFLAATRCRRGDTALPLTPQRWSRWSLAPSLAAAAPYLTRRLACNQLRSAWGWTARHGGNAFSMHSCDIALHA